MPDSTTTGPQFGQFERDTLPERIAARLLALIAERQLRPGDKLPPERDLAAAMHVSRTSLRQALAGLAMVNIVEIRQGSGAYVTSLKPELLVERFDFVFSLDDATYAEVLEARNIIEPGLAAAAAIRVTDEQIATLECWLDRSEAAVADEAAFLEVDFKLHELIVAAAGNRLMTRFMSTLTRVGVATRRRTGGTREVREHAYLQHKAIVQAIARRDPSAAAAAMETHMRKIERALREARSASADSENTDSFNIAPDEGDLTGGDYVTDHNVG